MCPPPQLETLDTILSLALEVKNGQKRDDAINAQSIINHRNGLVKVSLKCKITGPACKNVSKWPLYKLYVITLFKCTMIRPRKGVDTELYLNKQKQF